MSLLQTHSLMLFMFKSKAFLKVGPSVPLSEMVSSFHYFNHVRIVLLILKLSMAIPVVLRYDSESIIATL